TISKRDWSSDVCSSDLHQAIISEVLFNDVQDVLDGRGRKYRTKIDTAGEFPMRGFLLCPQCNRLLTGSKSKGRNRYYAYYHCVEIGRASCRERVELREE